MYKKSGNSRVVHFSKCIFFFFPQAGSTNPTVTLWLVELDDKMENPKSRILRPPSSKRFRYVRET